MHTTMRWAASAWRPCTMLGLWLGLTGCVIETDGERRQPCEDVRCADNGYCRDGACYCNTGWVGNPYAEHGCQSSRPGGDCSTTCGLNAYCESGACVCEQGFAAVCGTGDCLSLGQVCDGVPDCANQADEAEQTCARSVVQRWTLLDDCDDQEVIEWRLWARDRDWAWPSGDVVFLGPGDGLESTESIECLQGETICFGARGGERSWGVGTEGTGVCDDCCFLCSDQPIDLGGLACE